MSSLTRLVRTGCEYSCTRLATIIIQNSDDLKHTGIAKRTLQALAGGFRPQDAHLSFGGLSPPDSLLGSGSPPARPDIGPPWHGYFRARGPKFCLPEPPGDRPCPAPDGTTYEGRLRRISSPSFGAGLCFYSGLVAFVGFVGYCRAGLDSITCRFQHFFALQ